MPAVWTLVMDSMLSRDDACTYVRREEGGREGWRKGRGRKEKREKGEGGGREEEERDDVEEMAGENE